MKPNAIYRISEGVRTREENFGLLVVSKTTPALALNDDMKFVWCLINGKSTCGQILDAVKAQYDETDAEAKVDEMFATLIKVGLIQLIKEV